MFETCSILGDSISTFEGYIPKGNRVYYPHENSDVNTVEDTWWKIFLERSGLKLIINASYSGSKILENGTLPIDSGFLSETRLDALAGDCIFIFGGTNDYGTEPVTALEDAVAAYDLLIRKIQLKNPQSTIFCLTPLFRLNREEPNSAGWTLLQFVEAIKEKVMHYDQCFLIDLFAMPYDFTCTQDGLHPNKKGMRLLADYIYKHYSKIVRSFITDLPLLFRQ